MGEESEGPPDKGVHLESAPDQRLPEESEPCKSVPGGVALRWQHRPPSRRRMMAHRRRLDPGAKPRGQAEAGTVHVSLTLGRSCL